MSLEKTFREGIKDGVAIALGYLSVSFAFGMLAVQKGLPSWAPITISVTNFTGTGQFVGMDLMSSNATFLELAITMLIVNVRYTLMSLSLSQKLSPDMSLTQRLLVAFGNTDEVFAVSMQKKGSLTFRYLMGIMLTAYLGWTSGTLLGTFASSILTQSIRSALGIAIYGMFIAIIIPPARDSKPILGVIVLAVILSCACRLIPGVRSLSSGWIMILCSVIAAGVGAYIRPVRNAETEDEA